MILNKPIFFKPIVKRQTVGRLDLALKLSLSRWRELAKDINSGRPGMEGVSGGTSSESQGPCEGTWLNVGFTVFLVF